MRPWHDTSPPSPGLNWTGNEGAVITPREVLFEFIRIGNSVKVTAFDTKTLTEISIVGHPGASQEQLKTLALRRLQYVLHKQGKA